MEQDRSYWVSTMLNIVMPVLSFLSKERLKSEMPIERKEEERVSFAYLEAFGRTLCGIAPWLACERTDPVEAKKQQEVLQLVLCCMDHATNPNSPDFMNFCNGSQPLVDAAFLAHGFLRAEKVLQQEMTPKVKQQLVSCLQSTRSITPGANNWILFSAMIETALYRLDQPDYDLLRVKYALRQFMEWYLGDGIYGDGANFHMDYYNSFVIVPMLLDISQTFAPIDSEIANMVPIIRKRASRYAVILERMISPEGTYPIVGRSIPYRFGAFQLLSQACLQDFLPESLPANQVRCALTAVIKRVANQQNLFNSEEWLQIGVCGHQMGLGEQYINTGSLYLCSTVFLALGLPCDSIFWIGPHTKWTSLKVFDGEDISCDHFMEE